MVKCIKCVYVARFGGFSDSLTDAVKFRLEIVKQPRTVQFPQVRVRARWRHRQAGGTPYLAMRTLSDTESFFCVAHNRTFFTFLFSG